MPLETIIKELSSLSFNDLKAIKSRVDFLCKNTKSTTITKPKTSNTKNYILLCAKKFVSVPDVSVLERFNDHQMDDRLENAAQAIEQLAKDLDLNRKQLLKLCQIIVEASVLKVKANKELPLLLNTIINPMINPMMLLEENYPGYARLPVFKSMVLG